MEQHKIPVSELKGDLLALYVANACGYEVVPCNVPLSAYLRNTRSPSGYVVYKTDPNGIEHTELGFVFKSKGMFQDFIPYENWEQLGPLLDRFDILFEKYEDNEVLAYVYGTFSETAMYGPNRMVAACRAIVANAYGQEVDAEFTPLRGDVTELPEGLYWGQNNQHTYHCNNCGKMSDWYGEPHEFKYGNDNNVCGRSDRCLP